MNDLENLLKNLDPITIPKLDPNCKTVRLGGIDPDSLVNGERLRRVIFFQGCSLNCRGCFNPCTHDFNGGEEFKITDVMNEILNDKLIDGVTFSGGNPVEQPEALAFLVYLCKMNKKSVWLYSGYTFEELLRMASINPYINTILHYIDVLVDGRYVEGEFESGLKYKGSTNQRIIDVKESIIEQHLVEWDWE